MPFTFLIFNQRMLAKINDLHLRYILYCDVLFNQTGHGINWANGLLIKIITTI